LPRPVHSSDVALLFATRAVRLFAYGALSVILVLHLAAAGMDERAVGALFTATLLGDTAISLWITTRADRLGRRRMLVAGSALVVLAGAAFAVARSPWLLLAAATLGIVSPSGNEVGPFLAVEQAALAQRIPPERRTSAFAWYGLAGSLATALGALAGGAGAGALQRAGISPAASYRAVVIGYAALGAVLAVLFAALSPAVEAPAVPRAVERPALGLHRSRPVVLRLSALFAMDAFAGGFVVQSFLAWWFHERFGASPSLLGAIFFGANVLAGASSLAAAALARRIGLLRTMVATHLPSNVLLAVVPFMPTLPLAIAVLLLRFSISQMDVPTRQSYTMAVVEPDERSAAAGVTNIARTLGAAVAPVLAGPLYAAAALSGVPFLVSGGLKIAYDLLLWRSFRAIRAPGDR
jgi:predicted MFS family arabinose efflux permease